MVRLYTLLLLQGEPRHGYEIIKRIGELTGDEPSTSQVYPFLSKLADEELVAVEETGPRGKKRYELTGEGESFVADQVASLGEMLSAAVEGSVEECAHCDCEIYDGGVEVDGEMYCCRHCAAADD